MTYEERQKKLCDDCFANHSTCGYHNRKLEDKCSHLQDIMYGWELSRQDFIEEIEKELTRRMLDDYNQGAEEDEVAQGCMASMRMFVRNLKEK